MTLEDVANQLLLPISDDVDLATLEISPKEEAVEAELKNGMSGNAKLSYGLVLLLNSLWLPIVRPLLCFGFANLFLGPTPIMP